MNNTLADFPATSFVIHAYCSCGRVGRLNHGKLRQGMTLDELKAHLRCCQCGGQAVSIRVAWVAAGGFKYG